MYERYAIFYTPPRGPFASFGATWLGWDSAASARVQQPDISGLKLTEITTAPRKYGFHATLKAPFHLADSTQDAALFRAVKHVAARQKPAMIPKLSLVYDHGFVSLRPQGEMTALIDLAGNIVRDLDDYRAALSGADIARRRRTGLTPRQDAQMLAWGYPFIFDDYRFHMTLSGPVNAATADQIMSPLRTMTAHMIPSPLMIDAISVMGQDMRGMFHQLHRYPLGG